MGTVDDGRGEGRTFELTWRQTGLLRMVRLLIDRCGHVMWNGGSDSIRYGSLAISPTKRLR